uniref:Uncharacterized protein n=1 Tax=Rhizophagus irregularis (strain DAOM 181602 / DAOM 197198 / MUCL 43194) TaxID=747089 RepID=U9T150_RHIID
MTCIKEEIEILTLSICTLQQEMENEVKEACLNYGSQFFFTIRKNVIEPFIL